MAEVFKGTNIGTVTRPASALNQKVVSFFIVNKAGAANSINVKMGGVNITPVDKSLASGESYESDKTVLLLAGDELTVTSTGSVDYYFTLFNIADGAGGIK
jgi:hypothetical protein